MDEKTRTTHATYKTSEVARELGISAEWLRKGEERGFFPPARRDPESGHRYYTRSDVQRLRDRRERRIPRMPRG
jgi:DNA-binding transcriptional MerR regulator